MKNIFTNRWTWNKTLYEGKYICQYQDRTNYWYLPQCLLGHFPRCEQKEKNVLSRTENLPFENIPTWIVFFGCNLYFFGFNWPIIKFNKEKFILHICSPSSGPKIPSREKMPYNYLSTTFLDIYDILTGFSSKNLFFRDQVDHFSICPGTISKLTIRPPWRRICKISTLGTISKNSRPHTSRVLWWVP